MKANSISTIRIKTKPGSNKAHGLLTLGQKTIECRLGRTGISCFKHEGDGATPVGSFKILYGYFRPDRLVRPRTDLHLLEISRSDGWCDDVKSPNYNKPVRLPYPHSHEEMFRKDRLYDVCLVLDYNIHPVQREKGSAIFFHQTSEQLRPTEGCVAIDPQDMRRLLPFLTPETLVQIDS